MRKIYIFKNGRFTSAYNQLEVTPGSELDKWLRFQARTGVRSIWHWDQDPSSEYSLHVV